MYQLFAQKHKGQLEMEFYGVSIKTLAVRTQVLGSEPMFLKRQPWLRMLLTPVLGRLRQEDTRDSMVG